MTSKDLETQLRQLSNDLLLMSESEYPFQVTSISKLSDLDLSESTLISINDFLEKSATEREWHQADEKLIVIRYKKLLRFIEENCNITAVYKTQPPLATIYAIFKTDDELFVVLSSQVVET